MMILNILRLSKKIKTDDSSDDKSSVKILICILAANKSTDKDWRVIMKGHRKRCGCRAMSNRLLRPNTLYNGDS